MSLTAERKEKLLRAAKALATALGHELPDVLPALHKIIHRLSHTRHSEDFCSVNWYGTHHVFTAAQSAVVRVLWRAWEMGVPDVRQETLLVAAQSEAERVADVFKRHTAWGTMIQSAAKGTFRLAPPPAK